MVSFLKFLLTTWDVMDAVYYKSISQNLQQQLFLFFLPFQDRCQHHVLTVCMLGLWRVRCLHGGHVLTMSRICITTGQV